MMASPSLIVDCMPTTTAFLADIEVTEAADQAHAVRVAGALSKRRISSMSR